MTYKSKLLFVIVFIISLLFGARWAKSQIVNSPNLLPQTFTSANGWSGSNLNTNHGTGIIAGVNGQDVQYTYSLNNLLSKPQINSGFTSTAGADLYFWNNYNQNVIITQTLVDDNNISVTQNRIVSNNGLYAYSTYTDSIIVGTNSASNYNITVNYQFNVPGTAGHLGADLKNPTLYIAYESNPVILSTAQTTQIQTTTTSLNTTSTTLNTTSTTLNTTASTTTNTSDLETNLTSTTIIPTYESPVTSTNTLTSTTTETQNTNLQQSMITSDTSTSTKETSNATTSSPTQESTTSSTPTSTQTSTSSEATKTTSTETSTSTNTKTEGPQTQTNTKENVADTKVSTTEKGSVNVSVNVKTQIEKVERELKSIGDKTKAIQEIKIEALRTSQPNLDVYSNRAFYEPKQINGVPNPDFFNQINITQQQIYKDVSLSAYTNKDPIAVRQALQKEIEEEMNRLILEIEQLKRS